MFRNFIPKAKRGENRVGVASELVETFNFSEDITQLISLIRSMVYSNNDSVLKALLSNCTDALDKIGFESLDNPDCLADESKLILEITLNKDDRTITIRDTGCGMTKKELKSNLGTMKSGTWAFMASHKNLPLIGQFGVGFYSSYIVSEKVVLRTKHNDDEHWIWTSDGRGTFDIMKDPNPTITRGTEITLHLRDDVADYTDEKKLVHVVSKYGGYIGYPIHL